MKGAHAKVFDGGTMIVYRPKEGPLVIRYTNPEDELDLQVLCDRIDEVRPDFAADIKRHVIRPCYLLDPDTTSTIYGLCSKHDLFSKIPYDGTGMCPMNRLLLMLMLPVGAYDPNVTAAPDDAKVAIDAAADNPSDDTIRAMEQLGGACVRAGRLFRKLCATRDSIIGLINPPPTPTGQQPQQRYRLDEMRNVSQGDARQAGKTYLYLDANGKHHQRPVNLNYPQAVHRYKLPTKQIVKSNGQRANQPYDPFNERVFDNDAARLWFNKAVTAYRTMNIQYVRPKLMNQDIIWMGRDPPDEARSKKPSDQIADIIPAGSVRRTIMLLIECWLDFGQGRVSADELLDMISYLTLLPGISNGFGDSSHGDAYNKAVADNYRFLAAVAEMLGIPLNLPPVQPGFGQPPVDDSDDRSL